MEAGTWYFDIGQYLEVGVRRCDPLASKIIAGGQLLGQLLVLHHPLDVPLDHMVDQVRDLLGKPRLPGAHIYMFGQHGHIKEGLRAHVAHFKVVASNFLFALPLRDMSAHIH